MSGGIASDAPLRWPNAPLYATYEVLLGKMLNQEAVVGEHLAPYLRNTDVQWGRINTTDLPLMNFPPEIAARYVLRPGDILVCEGGDVGRCAIWSGEIAECYYQKALHRIRPRAPGQEPRFLAYGLEVAARSGAFEEGGSKATILHLPAEKLRKHRFPNPPAADQRAIADFLDKQTAGIDALIAKKERLIELLQEKRQALITQAVTKGLDPNVPTKDSGIEWLGEIPAHWRVHALRRSVSACDYGISESLEPSGETAVLRMNNLQDGELVVDDLKHTDAYPGPLLLREDDVLYNRTNSWALVGKAAVVGPEAVARSLGFASYLVRLRFRRAVRPRYACALFNSTWFLAEARSRAIPAISQANLSASQYVALPMIVPPVDEQDAIVDAVRAVDKQSRGTMDALRRQVALVREYRQALITAAVTGQLDVTQEPAA